MATRIKNALLLAASLSAVLVSLLQPSSAAAASSAWLDRLNGWRSIANLPALSENSTWSQGDYNHSLYMVKNDQATHYELSSLPYYTVAGDTAARNGNIEVRSSTAWTDSQAIDWWMAAPFHAINMMDPRLSSTGFGSYREVKSGWQAGFTLDTLRGNSFTGGRYPVYFPGNGSIVPGLTSYSGGEFPDPLQACPGYSVPTGLPAFIEVGGNVATAVSAHSFTGNGAALPHCVIDSASPTVGSNLTIRGGVIVIPQHPLVAGVAYTVALTVNGVAYSWSFGVSASTAMAAPGPPNGNVGGVATSSPSASSWGSYRTDVFVRGQDNGIWQRTWNGTWSGWASRGGTWTSKPGAVSWGQNRIDLFARAQDNTLQHAWSNGAAWSAWYPVAGGAFTSGASAASWGSGRLDVFARGQDNGLWHMSWNGVAWSSWQSLGGLLTSDPAAVSWGPDRIDIFARGQDNGIWHIAWTGSSWSSWQSLGGMLTTGPGAASCSYGHLDVFAVGAGGTVYQRGFNGVGWAGWADLRLAGTSDPTAVCPSSAATVQLYERIEDNSVLLTNVQGS